MRGRKLLAALLLCSQAAPAAALADVVYTETLRGPVGENGPQHVVTSQVYLNESALRREVLPSQETAPPGEYIPQIAGASNSPRLEILRLDEGTLWISAGGRLERHPIEEAGGRWAGLSRLGDLADFEIISSRPVLRRTGLLRKVNGHKCDHVFATVTCDARNRKTGERGQLILMNEMWVAKDVPQAAEIRRFRQKLGQRYGLAEYFCPDAPLFLEAVPELAKQMGDLTAKVKGLPISSTMTAKFKKKESGETVRTELLYSLTTDITGIQTVPHSPNVYELPR